MRLIDYFDAYVRAGLKIIPLYARTKIPVGKNWNGEWDHDWCRWSITKFPESNLGLLLGEIVDVEGDDEQANALIKSLIGDTPHPMYCSSKSIHHLFINPDPKLTSLRYNQIEFRANKHQSALPPSHHEDGSPYQWLKGTKFPAPEMPEALLSFYKGLLDRRPKLKPGHARPWCSVCSKRVYIHRKRYDLEKEVLDNLGYKWQCQGCREFDLRPLVRKLRHKSHEADKIRQV
jgi:hypothetical protein